MKNYFIILIFFSASLTTFAQSKSKYKVYAIKFAESGYHFSVADWVKNGPEKDSVNIDFMFWLIKGQEKTVLVDAGFLHDIPDAKDFIIHNYVRPDSILLKLNLKATDVTDIILTHPHWDHIDGIGLFPNAHIWIQKGDFEGFTSDESQKKCKNCGFVKRDIDMIVDLQKSGKVTLIDGDDKPIFPGIRVFTGSKHTFNSQFVLVETGNRKVIIASDNVWIYYNLEHMASASSAGTLDPDAYIRSMRRMKTLVQDEKYILPGHDAQVFSKFPSVTNDIVEIE